MLYEYKCKNCKKIIEKFVKMENRDISFNCPDCQGKMKRILSSCSFVIKGYNAANGYSKGE